MTEYELEASVITPSRGGRDRLPQLVAALAAQQDAPEFELIVVLDGDVDRSEQTLEQLAQQHSRLRLRWVVFPENRGRVSALNSGAEASLGRILIRCDDDMVPGAHYIRDHVRAHDPGPRGVIGLPRNVLPSTPYQRVYGDFADARHAADAYRLPADEQWRHWAGNVSVPREIHDELGGYDPDYRRYGWEDVDFGYRLHQAGYPVVIEPKLETAHHAAAVSTASRARRALYSGASRAIFIQKHGDAPLGGDRPPSGLWGWAVRAVATGSTSRTVQGWSVLDRVVDRLPGSLGRRVVSLAVEGAAEAGRSRPDRARENF